MLVGLHDARGDYLQEKLLTDRIALLAINNLRGGIIRALGKEIESDTIL